MTDLVNMAFVVSGDEATLKETMDLVERIPGLRIRFVNRGAKFYEVTRRMEAPTP